MGALAYSTLFIVALGMHLIGKRASGLGRDIGLAASIAIAGTWIATSFSVLHVLNLLMLRASTEPLWIAVVASTLPSLLMLGRFYCGWLCPFGALTELIARLPVRKLVITPSDDDAWRKVKYIVFGLIIALVLITRHSGYGKSQLWSSNKAHLGHHLRMHIYHQAYYFIDYYSGFS